MQSQGLKAARKSGFCPYFSGVFGGSALFASEIIGSENIGGFYGPNKNCLLLINGNFRRF
jgi:hypothetical protein